MRPMLIKKLPSQGRHSDQCFAATSVVPLDEATFIGCLPYWQAGARGAPRVHHLGVRPCPGTDPFEKIEYQRLYGVGHD